MLNTSLPIMLAALLSGVSVLLLIGGISVMSRKNDVQARLGRFLTVEGDNYELNVEDELAQPFSERVVRPLFRRFGNLLLWFWPQNRLDAVRTRLAMAGNPGGLGPIEFIGLKLLLMFVLGGGAMLIGYLVSFPLDSTAFILLVLLFICGFGLPDFWLGRRVTERQREILNSLPDALDMLLITTEAGMSFEGGVQEITGKWTNALSLEFARVLRDIGMGLTRREALSALADRTGVPEVISFTAALNQAEELGVSVGRVLRAQSEDMRLRRRQNAYERANQTPVKMMIPLVFLIFPSIFAVLLGPALVMVFERGGI